MLASGEKPETRRSELSSRTVELCLPPLRGYQEPVLFSEARDDLTVSAPQLGKTFVGRVWLLSACWYGGASPIPWWWIAPTYEQARFGYLGFCDYARSAGILGDATTSPPLRARLVNGSMIEAKSWDSPEGLYGPPIRGGVVDEFGQLTRLAYSAVSSRRAETVSRGEGRLRYLGNVGEMGTIAEELWRLAESGAPGFACRRWTWRDRAEAHDCRCAEDAGQVIVSGGGLHLQGCPRGEYVEFIDRERSRMSGPQFRMLYEAEWVDWNDVPAYSFDRALHVTERADYQPGPCVDLSCDFNVDPMCWVLGQHTSREAWDFDEIAILGGATTEATCAELIARLPARKVQTVEIFGDASGNARSPKSHLTDYQIIARELSRAGIPFSMRVPAGNPAVSSRLNAVNGMLRSADGTTRYSVHPRCMTLINDFARVALKPGTRDIDKRNRKLTHASDAAGYRLVELFPVESAAGPGLTHAGVLGAALQQSEMMHQW